eukprot:4597171-Prymnesium_polylepis.1
MSQWGAPASWHRVAHAPLSNTRTARIDPIVAHYTLRLGGVGTADGGQSAPGCAWGAGIFKSPCA